eukprot:1287431-Rhodomonas_salina.1
MGLSKAGHERLHIEEIDCRLVLQLEAAQRAFTTVKDLCEHLRICALTSIVKDLAHSKIAEANAWRMADNHLLAYKATASASAVPMSICTVTTAISIVQKHIEQMQDKIVTPAAALALKAGGPKTVLKVGSKGVKTVEFEDEDVTAESRKIQNFNDAAIEFKQSYSSLRTAVPSFERARATRAELRSGTCTQGVLAPLQCVNFEFSRVTTVKLGGQITEWFAKSGTNREAKEREGGNNQQRLADSQTSGWCWKRQENKHGQLVGWKTRKCGVWGMHWIPHWRRFRRHLVGHDWYWTVGKELDTMSLAPSFASMKALQNKIAVAKQQKKDMAEQEARRQADDEPGAAHGRGQFQRQKLLAQAAAVAAAEKALQKEVVEAQRMQEEEVQLVVAMELIEDMEQIVIEKEQMKAASHALTGHLQHTLCNYDLLKTMVALGAKIAGRGTSEVVQPVGTDIELLVLWLPLELTPVNLYRSFSGQMAPGDNLSFRPGILDMPPVRTKVDGTPLTEGKYTVIHVRMTAELRTFLRTGHGWEMGIEALDGSS